MANSKCPKVTELFPLYLYIYFTSNSKLWTDNSKQFCREMGVNASKLRQKWRKKTKIHLLLFFLHKNEIPCDDTLSIMRRLTAAVCVACKTTNAQVLENCKWRFWKCHCHIKPKFRSYNIFVKCALHCTVPLTNILYQLWHFELAT